MSFWLQGRRRRVPVALPTEVDIVVIGSGLSGASCAYHLCRDGTGIIANRGGVNTKRDNVLLLDAREEVAGAATGRNGGLLHAASWWDIPKLARQHGLMTACRYVQFEQANRRALREYCAGREDELVRDVPCLKVFEKAAPFDAAVGFWQAQIWRAPLAFFGLEFLATSSEARAAIALRPPRGSNGEETRDGHEGEEARSTRAVRLRGAVDSIWAARVAQRLVLEAEEMGARVATSARVVSAVDEGESEESGVLLTVEGVGVIGGRATVRAQRVVHCTNAAAPALLPRLRGCIVPVRNHLVATAPLPPLLPTVLSTAAPAARSSTGGGGEFLLFILISCMTEFFINLMLFLN